MPSPGLLLGATTFCFPDDSASALLPETDPLRSFICDCSPADAIAVSIRHNSTAPVPAIAPCMHHRAGWELRADGDRYVAALPIPQGCSDWQRIVEISERQTVIHIPGNAYREDQPLGCLITELLWLVYQRWNPGVLLHAAGVCLDDTALLFAGESSAGKSTIATLWSEAGHIVLADESVMLWREGPEILAGGTPWPGSAGVWSNCRAKAGALYLLEHGKTNRIEKLTGADGITEVMRQSFLPHWDRSSLEMTTDLIGDTCRQAPPARLAFVPDESVVELLVQGRSIKN